MWIKIIGENFKELLEILKQRPIALIILGLIYSTGFFINKWTDYHGICKDDIEKKDILIKELLDSLSITNSKVYEWKYQSLYYEKLYQINIKNTDSLIIERFIKPLDELNNKK